MTTYKGKHLIAALSSSAAPRVQLPDPLYEAFPDLLKHSWAEVVERGLVMIAPAAGRGAPGRLLRSELGVLPRSLMEQLDLHESIVDFVVRGLAPRCTGCGAVAERPREVLSFAIPSAGFVAACVVDERSPISLQERCDLLGVERAVVGERLVRVEGLAEEDVGDPVVVIVAVHDRIRLDDEISRWFARGGSDLRMLHFEGREGEGRELGRCSRSWQCRTCSTFFEAPSRQVLNDLRPCSVCRGAGWLPVEGGRYAACRDCSGFGSLDDARRFDFGGIELQVVATLSFGEMLQRVEAAGHGVADTELTAKLRVVCEAGLEHYPIGGSIDLLSKGECVLISIAAGRLSRLEEITYVVDGAVVGGDRNEFIPSALHSDLRIVVPESSVLSPRCSHAETSESIILRDVRRGPLQIAEVSFPVGALSTLQGPVGVGKSLLLDTIAERFSKRRKLAHSSAFGRVKRCHMIRDEERSQGVLLQLLGLSGELAGEISRTKHAKLSGIIGQDLDLSSSAYRCGECCGLGVVSDGQVCGVCDGALFDWRVADLEIGGAPVGRLLHMPIGDLKELFWASDRLSYLLSRFPAQYASGLRLNTPIREIAPEVRRFLRIWGALVGLAASQRVAKKGALAEDLVLIDGPGPLVAAHLQELAGLLGELSAAGATVIYGGIPESLESQCSCVLRLAFSAGADKRRDAEEFLDARYARISGVSGC